MANDVNTAISKLETAYDKVLQQCYDALAEDTPQETRDALREAISGFLENAD
jgi:hypothetical protein